MSARIACAALGVAVAMLAGCAEGDKPLGVSGENAVPTCSADPAEVVAAHAAFLGAMDLEGYTALLDPAFEFVPQDSDADDFPWVTPDDPWDLQDELGIIGHMMDSTFVSQETGHSVRSMEMNLTITQTRAVGVGGTEITCAADILVLWAVSDGARSDVRLLFTLYPDEDGCQRIRRIRELPAFGRAAATEEGASWGAIKSLYR